MALKETNMIRIFDAETGAELGVLTEEQFLFLADRLEEEEEGDQDYYINTDTLEALEEEGADPALLDLLRKALAGREETDITWKKA